ncbi:glycosyltransferase family 2 protein [Clostridium neuense]|uniref:Glycosyltransferase family 2 protein n=1 Tax=Clostridium neuense TaxID=1728934 RepID=A0ABW8TBP4_9CLOT
MNKIAAVVVTYNRKEKLSINLKCLLNQKRNLDRIYIVDNGSTDGTDKMIQEMLLQHKNIQYIRLHNNIGGSGGFYVGIKSAYDDGFEYIWGMDDDAYPNEDALLQLESVRERLPQDVCLWSNCDMDIDFDKNDYKEVDFWIFVGFYISRNVISKVGFPRADFFIYHDDVEYANRIKRFGYKIIKVKNSIINHKSFEQRKFYEKKICGKLIKFPIMNDWRIYYLVRNSILMYKISDIKRYRQIFITNPKIFLKIVLLNTDQKLIFLRGYIDGILNISGIKVLP